MAWCNTMAWRRFGVCIVVLCVSAMAWAADRTARKPQSDEVELFSAIEKKLIEVQLIPKDSSECRLLIANKTDKPLSVMLPDVLAGVPVLAQRENIRPDKAPQQIGIGNTLFQNPLGRGNQNGFMNIPDVGNRPGQNQRPFRAFNVAPEKVGQLKLPAVCLDPNNPSPRAAIPYEVKPLASVSNQPGVAEICAMLGRGAIKQGVAQLAVWHLNNGVSWEKLATKKRKYDLLNKPLYSADEIETARKEADKAVKLAKASSTIQTPSDRPMKN